MPDRVIRDELLQSVRWLDLPSDTHRLIYENLILIADDYGNVEGGPRRLFRWMHGFTQVKTEADAIKIMSDLQDADMVRRYEIKPELSTELSTEYWHLPRFKNSRWYWKRSYPQSPFSDDVTNEDKQRPSGNGNTHVANTLPTRREGVGVGVGEILNPARDKSPKRQTRQQGPPWWETESGIIRKGDELGISPRPGESMPQFKSRVDAKLQTA